MSTDYLALAGLLIILTVILSIMTQRVSIIVALIGIPILAALWLGFDSIAISGFIVQGVQDLSPTIGMFIFAILFFGILRDAGMLDPIVDWTLKKVGVQPTKIIVGTALLTAVIHLDGSGSATFLVVIPALLPLYEHLGIDRRILACIVTLSVGVLNSLPWAGPSIRAASALNMSVTDITNPLIPVQLTGLACVCLLAWYLGRKEERRLANTLHDKQISWSTTSHSPDAVCAETQSLKRPHLFWFNVGLMILTIVSMVAKLMSPIGCFMVGTALALLINYRSVSLQKKLVMAHARNSMNMAIILLAVAVFSGIMQQTNMLAAMSEVLAQNIPPERANHLPFVLGLLSVPLSFFFDPDSFYYIILPLLAETGSSLGVPPIQMAQAALIGQMTVGFPISPLAPSTFLLIGLAKIELSTHQRFTFLYALLISWVMTFAAVLWGLFPLG